MDNLKYWLWLSSLEDIGPIRARSLLEHFKIPENVWYASKNQLMMAEGIGEKLADIIASSKNEALLEKQLNKIKNSNVDVITLDNNLFPANLKNIYSPPAVLFSMGELKVQDSAAVAIVGSRNASAYGIKAAYDIARELARAGITVVSGLARGIDTAAHKGALDGGGRTIAVLGCGLDFVYPAENKDLMKRIAKDGAVVTEYQIGTKPDPKHFPRRNRIISGASLGTVVVEASKRSGSLITADFALEQGRDVFAVPGQIYSRTSEGTNYLIKQGARPVTGFEDILEALSIEFINTAEVKEEKVDAEKLGLNNEESVIFSSISNIPIHLENILKQTGFTIGRLNTIITILELKGLIKQLPGKQFVRS